MKTPKMTKIDIQKAQNHFINSTSNSINGTPISGSKISNTTFTRAQKDFQKRNQGFNNLAMDMGNDLQARYSSTPKSGKIFNHNQNQNPMNYALVQENTDENISEQKSTIV